jgi:antitoxin ParD1/3/4
MNVTLTPELEAMVRHRVASGRYPSASEVIHEALRLLEERDRLRELRASLARADEQIDRGDAVEWTPELLERLSQEAEELVRQGAQPRPDVCP